MAGTRSGSASCGRRGEVGAEKEGREEIESPDICDSPGLLVMERSPSRVFQNGMNRREGRPLGVPIERSLRGR